MRYALAEEISSRVKEVVEYSDAQAVARRCGRNPATGKRDCCSCEEHYAATAEINTRTVVEGVRRDIQAQLEQTRTDALWREQEAQHRVEKISKQLQTLTNQLNKFQPVSEHTVGVTQEKLSEQVQQQFDAQQERMRDYLMLCWRVEKRHKLMLTLCTVYWLV